MTVVFRVVKTKNYTMMSNQHLKDKRLTLKVPSSIMRKFIYKSGRTQSAQGRETCP